MAGGFRVRKDDKGGRFDNVPATREPDVSGGGERALQDRGIGVERAAASEGARRRRVGPDVERETKDGARSQDARGEEVRRERRRKTERGQGQGKRTRGAVARASGSRGRPRGDHGRRKSDTQAGDHLPFQPRPGPGARRPGVPVTSAEDQREVSRSSSSLSSLLVLPPGGWSTASETTLRGVWCGEWGLRVNSNGSGKVCFPSRATPTSLPWD